MSADLIATWLAEALADHRAGRLAQAEAGYRKVLERQPDHPEALHLLGALAHQVGKHDLAISLISRAIQLSPNRGDFHNNLGAAFRAKGDFARAVREFEQALKLRMDYADARENLREAMLDYGDLLHRQIQIDAAEKAYQAALLLDPKNAAAYNNHANVLRDQANFPAAMAAYRKAVDLQPDLPVLHSNLLFCGYFDPSMNLKEIAREHERFNQRHVAELEAGPVDHRNDRNPDRRLKVGYVSQDFRGQAEAYFVLPLLEAHDRGSFEIHGYSSTVSTDDITARHRRTMDGWHEVRELSDEALADRIRADGIDILVDLTMHMRGNRLRTFARRPAPVQMTWLAYPGTTGLRSIGYRLTDGYLDPVDSNASWSTERPVRLPDCWVCYDPLTREPEVNGLPAKMAEHVTFGSLNQYCKHHDGVIELWGRMMSQVNGSRLVLMCASQEHGRRVLKILEGHGVGPQRIDFVSRHPRAEYLKSYHRIDIALDPFPYNGITTTCDALWMGVPVVSLAGTMPASRAGMGILTTVGLPELVVGNEVEFITTCRSLAGNLGRLSELRAGLRARVEGSRLMDAKRFAQNVEAAYHMAWREWCAM